MPGLSFTKEDLNYAAGSIAFNLRKEYEKSLVLNNIIQSLTNPDWTTLGITDTDRDILKGAYADLAYQKVTAFDSSSYVKKLWGLGV